MRDFARSIGAPDQFAEDGRKVFTRTVYGDQAGNECIQDQWGHLSHAGTAMVAPRIAAHMNAGETNRQWC